MPPRRGARGEAPSGALLRLLVRERSPDRQRRAEVVRGARRCAAPDVLPSPPWRLPPSRRRSDLRVTQLPRRCRGAAGRVRRASPESPVPRRRAGAERSQASSATVAPAQASLRRRPGSQGRRPVLLAARRFRLPPAAAAALLAVAAAEKAHLLAVRRGPAASATIGSAQEQAVPGSAVVRVPVPTQVATVPAGSRSARPPRQASCRPTQVGLVVARGGPPATKRLIAEVAVAATHPATRVSRRV
jgi:hypothetical protein